MAHKFTEEQLNSADRALLIQMILNLQDQSEALTKEVHALNEKMQLMMEQLVLAKKDRFGRSSEKMDSPGQICFMEVDGNIVFFYEDAHALSKAIKRPFLEAGDRFEEGFLMDVETQSKAKEADFHRVAGNAFLEGGVRAKGHPLGEV